MKPRNIHGYESQESPEITAFLQEMSTAKPQKFVGFI